jgi:hypothetical protein
MMKHEQGKGDEGAREKSAREVSQDSGTPELAGHELKARQEALQDISDEELARLLDEADAKGPIPPELLALAESRLSLSPVQEAAIRALFKQRIDDAREKYGEVFSDADLARIREKAKSEESRD